MSNKTFSSQAKCTHYMRGRLSDVYRQLLPETILPQNPESLDLCRLAFSDRHQLVWLSRADIGSSNYCAYITLSLMDTRKGFVGLNVARSRDVRSTLILLV
jgi:hypothetical protein